MDLAFAVLLVAVVGYEGLALYFKRKGDTISEHTWDVRRFLWGRIGVDSLTTWLLWHLTIDPVVGVEGASPFDLIFVGLGTGWALWSWRNEHGG